MAKRPEDLTVDFTSIMRLSVTNRVQMAQSKQGQSFLASLTPEQYAMLFPKYYERYVPSYSNLQSAVSGGTPSVGGGRAGGGGGGGAGGGGGGGGAPTVSSTPTQSDPPWLLSLRQAVSGGANQAVSLSNDNPLALDRQNAAKSLTQQQKLHMYALAVAEKGDHSSKRTIMLMESIYNRYYAQKKPSLMSTMGADYYEPLMEHDVRGRARYQAALKKLQDDPSYFKKLDDWHNQVLSGSNYTNLGTHNASAGTARSARQTQTVTADIDEEVYSRKDIEKFAKTHGLGTVRKEKAWYDSMKKRMDEYYANQANKTNIQKPTVIFGEGLTNTGVPKNTQIANVRKRFGADVSSYGYSDVDGILKAIEQNKGSNVPVVLYSASAQHAAKVAQAMKNAGMSLNNLHIVEPYFARGGPTVSSVKDAISLGMPVGNLQVGPTPERGAGVIEGATQTSANVGHGDALSQGPGQTGAIQPGTSKGFQPASQQKFDFTEDELKKLKNVNPRVIEQFEKLQKAYGKKIGIESGYRDPEHNARVGGAKHSQHIKGTALDLDTGHLSREERIKIIKIASAMGFQGIGVYQNNLHIDIAGKRAWGPDYSAKTLPNWAKEVINGHLKGAYTEDSIKDITAPVEAVQPPATFEKLPDAIKEQIKNMSPEKQAEVFNLMNQVPNHVEIITNAYNANPQQTTAVIENVTESPPGTMPEKLQELSEMQFFEGGPYKAPTSQQREEIYKKGGVVVNLDMNSGGNNKQTAPEIIIPDDATPEMRAKAEEYVRKVEQAYKNKFGKSLGGRVLTRSENRARNPERVRKDPEYKGGRTGTIHTEPINIQDDAAVEYFTRDPEGRKVLAQITASTLGTIKGSQFSQPHTVSTRDETKFDTGAYNSRLKVNEVDTSQNLLQDLQAMKAQAQAAKAAQVTAQATAPAPPGPNQTGAVQPTPAAGGPQPTAPAPQQTATPAPAAAQQTATPAPVQASAQAPAPAAAPAPQQTATPAPAMATGDGEITIKGGTSKTVPGDNQPIMVGNRVVGYKNAGEQTRVQVVRGTDPNDLRQAANETREIVREVERSYDTMPETQQSASNVERAPTRTAPETVSNRNLNQTRSTIVTAFEHLTVSQQRAQMRNDTEASHYSSRSSITSFA